MKIKKTLLEKLIKEEVGHVIKAGGVNPTRFMDMESTREWVHNAANWLRDISHELDENAGQEMNMIAEGLEAAMEAVYEHGQNKEDDDRGYDI